jgi:hypothetical protein
MDETLLLWLERWLGPTLTYRKVAGETPEWSRGRAGSWNGSFWMRNGSEFRNGAVVSSLSEILETGEVDPHYFLSHTACRGILRRAEKRGRALPEALHAALTGAASTAKGTMPT